MSKKKKTLIIVAVTAFIVAVGYGYFDSASWTYSEGSRVGVVTKFSKKGTIWKTWEGELTVASQNVRAPMESWQFSVEDGTDAVGKVQKAMDGGQRVKLPYRQQYRVQGWKGKTTYFVNDVQGMER